MIRLSQLWSRGGFWLFMGKLNKQDLTFNDFFSIRAQPELFGVVAWGRGVWSNETVVAFPVIYARFFKEKGYTLYGSPVHHGATIQLYQPKSANSSPIVHELSFNYVGSKSSMILWLNLEYMAYSD